MNTPEQEDFQRLIAYLVWEGRGRQGSAQENWDIAGQIIPQLVVRVMFVEEIEEDSEAPPLAERRERKKRRAPTGRRPCRHHA